MKASVLSLLGVAAAVSAGHYHGEKPSTTSTVYATSVYTITSCKPEVTDCPEKGSVTTDYISLYTTVCPLETESSTYPPTSTEAPWTTSTIYYTTEYTVTACPPTVTNCPVGSKTTETLTTTTYCPVTTEYPTYPPTEYLTYPPSQPSGPSYPPSKASGIVAPPSKPSYPAIPPPVYTTETISTCVPTVITSIYTITAAPAGPTYPVAPVGSGYPAAPPKPYSTGASTGSYPVSSTVPFTGAASANKVGGLMMAVGLVAALL